MMPYYSQRRTLMLRDDIMRSPKLLEAAIANLKGTPVALLVLRDTSRGNRQVVQLAARHLGVDEREALNWNGDQIFLHRDIRTEILNRVEGEGINRYHGLAFGSNVTARERALANKVVSYASLSARHKKLFQGIHPAPTSFFFTVGPELWNEAGEKRLFVHPESKLWFDLVPGSYRFQTTITMTPSSYVDVPATDATDGVSLVATWIDAHNQRQELARRQISPRDKAEDRGVLAIDWTLALPAEGQLEIAVLAGPAGNAARDWVTLGKIRIDRDPLAK